MRGINIGQTSVGKNMVRLIKPSSPIWRTFLDNHLKSFVSVDFFTVPTIGFQVLYVFLVLAHDRRQIFHFNGTAHPTAEWTGQQLLKTFPFDRVTRNLLRDSDGIFGSDLSNVLSAPRSRWQRAYIASVIGTIRRECLDPLMGFSEASLPLTLSSYFGYYHGERTHLFCCNDARHPRPCGQQCRDAALPLRGWGACITGTSAARPHCLHPTLSQA
ncbi:MAG: transposase [Acidobacteria bacterium]|nr:transposase [Acidobacteriota bacterium]